MFGSDLRSTADGATADRPIHAPPINDPFRVRYDYCAANPFDELAWLFPPFDAATATVWPRRGHEGRISRYHESACQAHHIWGGAFGSSRIDAVTNLVHVSQTAHDWLERYRLDGFALCYACKLLKREWNDEESYKISGIPDARAYIETLRFEFPWVGPTVERCERMGTD